MNAPGQLSAESPETPFILDNAPVVLRVRGLCKSFGGQVVLNGVDLELRRGEIVLLRGDNGSGKTTLLNILTGNLEPDAGSIQIFTNGTKEAFEFPRRWWRDFNPFDHFLPERVAREGVGRSWQDIRLFGAQSLLDNIAVATPHHPGERPVTCLFRRPTTARAEARTAAEAKAVLSNLGLGGRESSSGDMVSLGQAKRVAIARAIRAGARILFLDEPLSGLDARGIQDIIGLLRKLAREHDMTLVIIEHVLNASYILDLASTIWTLREGKVLPAPAKAVKPSDLSRDDNKINVWIRVLSCGSGNARETRLPNGATLTVVDRAHSCDREVLLELQNVTVYRGRRLVLGESNLNGESAGISFKLHRGQIGILQAPNGWGKTTLLDSLMGIIPIHSGSVLLLGDELTNGPIWARARSGIGLMRTRANTFASLDVGDILALSGVPPQDGDGVRRLIGRTAGELSGGESQLLAWHCATDPDSALQLLDEPFTAMDNNNLDSMIEHIKYQTDVTFLIAVPSFVKGEYTS